MVNSNKYTIVERSDYYELSKYIWFLDLNEKKRCRSVIRFAPETSSTAPMSMHREIMFVLRHKGSKAHGHREKRLQQVSGQVKLFVDHINNDPIDNRRCNLRLATPGQNVLNKGPDSGNTTSKYKGVSKRKGRKNWRVRINYQGKRYSLGTFENEIDAAKAYDEAAKKYYGQFAYLNFPQKKLKGLRDIILAFFSKR